MPIKFARILGIAVFIAVILATSTALSAQPAVVDAFGFDQVVTKAKKLSQKGYKKPSAVAKKYQKLSREQWRSIQTREIALLWPGANFTIRLRPAGYLYKYPVKIHVLNAQGNFSLDFSPDMFKYSKKKLGLDLPKDLGFAGFQVFYPLPKAGDEKSKKDGGTTAGEILSFLGASYFRARAAGQVLGLSARGLAVNTATDAGEEFPIFREFWLARPARDDHVMVIYALLDSPSVTGAYRFSVWPGSPTKMHVKAVLFPRNKIEKLGLAPLTSMYYYGQGRKRPKGYTYPAVHNSDGLLLETGDKKWIWRPLSNPDSLSDTGFFFKNPRGFGLMQRDRRSSDYPTVAKPYSQRPSAWVAPHGDWGKGHVELVEIPEPNENNDNISAFWVPDKPPKPHKAFHLSYDIYWQGRQPRRSPLGHVVATRMNAAKSDKADRRFAVDFSGGPLKTIHSADKIKTLVEAGKNGKIVDSHLQRDPDNGHWRLAFSVKDKNGKPLQLRARLVKDKKPLTETWDYVMPGP
jgi:glucans biosynthesis protein